MAHNCPHCGAPIDRNPPPEMSNPSSGNTAQAKCPTCLTNYAMHFSHAGEVVVTRVGDRIELVEDSGMPGLGAPAGSIGRVTQIQDDSYPGMIWVAFDTNVETLAPGADKWVGLPREDEGT